MAWLIYKITNLLNGKVYIGQTRQDLEQRWREHKSRARKYRYPLYLAIAKYGSENFSIETVETCDSQAECNLQERWHIFINMSTSREVGYNVLDGGDSPPEMTDELRAKISAGLKRWMTPEKKAQISASKTGKPNLKMRGRKFSDEQLANMRKPKSVKIYKKLSPEKIEAIKTDTRSSKLIALEYGISRTRVNQIRRMKT